MKKLFILCTFALAAMVAFPGTAAAQDMPGIDASPLDLAFFRPDGRNADPAIRVMYSRPQLKGRAMIGDQIPYGKVWRTGANETTEIKLYADAKIAGQEVAAGTYSLYSIPGEDKWTIILNSKLDTWGAYMYDESKDVLRVEVDGSMADEEAEVFTIMFKPVDGGAHMIMAWGKHRVAVPFTIM